MLNVFHKHLLISAYVKNPPVMEERMIEWLDELVRIIDMNKIHGPIAHYVNKEGNKGLTATVMIETSHISIHVWDEVRPALVQFDVYSCKDFDEHDVIKHFDQFDIDRLTYRLIDRNY